MKSSKRTLAAMALFAGAMTSASSFAITKYDLLGTSTPMASSPAQRTILVDSGTRWINVNYGETVRFVLPGAGEENSFTWRFDGLGNQVQLSELFPGAAQIPIYVNQDDNLLLRPHS